MGISVQAIVILLIYAIGINVILFELIRVGIGIECPSMIARYNETNRSAGWSEITDLALGRCEGIPATIILIFELPIIAGLIYIIRAYVGAT